MTHNTSFFRQEAVDYWTGQRDPDRVLRVGAPWVRWLYWTVVLLVVVGLAGAFAVRTEETASGPARLDPEHRSFVAALPAVVRSGVETRDVRIEFSGTSLPARIIRTENVDGAELGGRGLASPPGPAILVTGTVTGDTAGIDNRSGTPLHAQVIVVVSRDRLLSTLWRGLNGAL